MAEVYLSLGNELFEGGQLRPALKNFDLAIQWNPNYEKACLNKIILLNKIEGGEKQQSLEILSPLKVPTDGKNTGE